MDDHDPVYQGIITSIAVVDECMNLRLHSLILPSQRDICELDLLVSTNGPSRPVLGMVCKSSIVREKEIELVIRVYFPPATQQQPFVRQGSTWNFNGFAIW